MKKTRNKNIKSFENLFSNRLIKNSKNIYQDFNYSKDNLDMLELELDYNKNIITKLKKELNSKNKEISLLKVTNNKKEEEHQKNIRLIEGILKQSDQSTKTGFNLIENKISNLDLNNYKNEKELANQIPKVGNMLHFNPEQKTILKKIIFSYRIKNQIDNLNEEISHKNEKINEFKNNRNIINFNVLKKSYDTLNELKNENKFMKNKMGDSFYQLKVQKEKNIFLKKKLNSFQNNYKNYKNKIMKKTISLDNAFIDLENRNLQQKIFNKRKGKNENNINFSSDKDIKRLSASMIQLKKSNNLENEIEKINERKELLDKEISKLLLINESLQKDLQEINKKKEIEEKNAIEEKNTFKLIIENKKNKNIELKEINKNINKEVRKKEKLIDEEKKGQMI